MIDLLEQRCLSSMIPIIEGSLCSFNKCLCQMKVMYRVLQQFIFSAFDDPPIQLIYILLITAQSDWSSVSNTGSIIWMLLLMVVILSPNTSPQQLLSCHTINTLCYHTCPTVSLFSAVMCKNTLHGCLEDVQVWFTIPREVYKCFTIGVDFITKSCSVNQKSVSEALCKLQAVFSSYPHTSAIQ